MTTASELTPSDINRIIEMAWEDRTPFEAIEWQFGLGVPQVLELMRHQLSPASFRRWRRRTNGRPTKHQRLRQEEVQRFKCDRQRTISGNRIAKRSSRA